MNGSERVTINGNVGTPSSEFNGRRESRNDLIWVAVGVEFTFLPPHLKKQMQLSVPFVAQHHPTFLGESRECEGLGFRHDVALTPCTRRCTCINRNTIGLDAFEFFCPNPASDGDVKKHQEHLVPIFCASTSSAS